jgi:hypothetical protein
MAISNTKQFRTRSYLAKDFDSLRSQLLQYARLYYPDKIQDFSETSMGGMLLDLAAYTGDIMSFYLDHQYNELDPTTAIENKNIEKLILAAGVKITGSSPALVDITVYIEVPAVTIDGSIVPSPSALPIIKQNSTFTSSTGVTFSLLADIDFSKKNSSGNFVASVKVGKLTSSGAPATFTMAMDGTCISGIQTSETFSLGSFVPFKTITLSQRNVTDILSAYDNQGNTYYEVSSLTDDVVYRNVLNLSRDSKEISEALKVVPAPYRFITSTDLSSRSTSLTLGGGKDDNIEADAVPDPSDFAISFPYSKTFSRTSINPLQLLKTRTLGIYAVNSQLTVTYRYGGGLNHNVGPNTIINISQATVEFPLNPRLEIRASVRSSMGVTNKKNASGGEDAPTVDVLKALVPSARNAQERIVTREDLLARIYSIPSNFGRVFRAAVRPNPDNPLSTQLFIICRTSDSKLIYAQDTLKENLRKYLAPYRLINDAIDILDAYIINLSLTFDVVTDPSLNQQLILQSILSNLNEQLQTTNYSIDQPIVISDIQNLIYATTGVLSINKIQFRNLTGTINGIEYSETQFNVDDNTRKGMIYPPPGGMFEFKYPEIDIIGRTVI